LPGKTRPSKGTDDIGSSLVEAGSSLIISSGSCSRVARRAEIEGAIGMTSWQGPEWIGRHFEKCESQREQGRRSTVSSQKAAYQERHRI